KNSALRTNPTGRRSQRTGRTSFLNSAGIRTPPSSNLICFPLSPQTGSTRLLTCLHFLFFWYLAIKLFAITHGSSLIVFARRFHSTSQHTATQARAFLTKASSTGRRESGTLTLTQQVTVSTILACLLSSARSSVERFSLTFPCFEPCFLDGERDGRQQGLSLAANPTAPISFSATLPL